MTFDSRMSYDASYVKARKKAVKQLRNNNAQQLENETKKMEERIRALKEQMFKEKEEREKLGGTRWASGKAGPLNSHAQDVLKKKSLKVDKSQRRIKVLGDEPLQSYKKKATPRAQQPDDFGASGCGQCERTKATLVCVECAEKYCISCFMSFHQKGALKKHCTQSVEQYEATQLRGKETNSVNNNNKPELSSSKKLTRVTSQGQAKSPQFDNSTRQEGGALLEGSYNEEESKQSFAQALMEWRNAGKEEKMWKNPSHAKSSTCETSTTPEPLKQPEVKVSFGPNKSLSYLDRMLLKKHHGDPNFTSQLTPPKEVKSRGTRQTSPSNDSQAKSENRLGTNYREIFQSLGVASTETESSSKGALVIEEVSDDDLSGEETTAYIVEEQDCHVHPERRPVSRSGRVSITYMTASGDFEGDGEALVLKGVSSVSSISPISDRSPRLGVTKNKEPHIKDGFRRVWSPQPCHVGLSEFFMAGVKDDVASVGQSRKRVTAFGPASVTPDDLSKSLLSQNVWKPQESVIENADGENVQEKIQEAGSGSQARHESPRPIIPLLREPELLAESRDRPDCRSSTISMPVTTDVYCETKIHDFGIVDFLKTQPNLPNGFDDYSLVHRVSTVSPLTLSPNPPTFHWSDDSDDEFLEKLCSQTTHAEMRADQDEADRATLTDLDWELVSTTGRLTRCDSDGEKVEEKKGTWEDQDEFDEDSIENDDFGPGLSSSEEDTACDFYSANSNRTKQRHENAMAEEEVHALN